MFELCFGSFARLNPFVFSHVPRYAFILMLALGLSGCGGGGGSSGTDAQTSDGFPVGPEGGTVTIASPNNSNVSVKLVIPPGALSEQTNITVSQATDFPANSGVMANTAFDFGPDGLAFSVPAQLTITYDEGTLGTLSENSLRLNKASGAGWGQVAGSSVDTSANSVSGSISSFSIYSALGAAPPGLGVVPANSAKIKGSTQIVITFAETMDIASLALGGSMAAEDNGGVWSFGDTVLTISPAASWSDGAHTLTVTAAALATAADTTVNLGYTVDAIVPTGGANPAGGTSIASSRQIVITYDEAMDTGSFPLGGTLAAESDGGVWSAGNTVLTFTPTTNWTGGAGRTLTVDASDEAGNPAAQISVTYTVDVSLPTGAAVPTNGAKISTSESIIITFSETMNTASLALAGSMAVQAAAAVWSVADTVLTISPAPSWSGGAHTLTVDADDLVANGVSLVLSYTVDVTSPLVVLVTPSNNSPISWEDAIEIRFDETMNTSVFTVGGLMAGVAFVPTWSTTSVADDTLTITPTTTWAAGSSRTLIVDAQDAAGNALTTLNLIYGVLEGVVYVHTPALGGDAKAGTQLQPKATIQAGLDLAAALFPGTGEVRVAAGIYPINSSVSGSIQITGAHDGLSLLGGYSASNWAIRNSATNVTMITDSAPTANGITRAVIRIDNGLLTTPIDSFLLDGFTIRGTSGTASATSDRTIGVWIKGGPNTPTLSNNIIMGGDGAATIGVLIEQAGLASDPIVNFVWPVLSNNNISGRNVGGRAANLALDIGVQVENGARAEFYDNDIFNATASTDALVSIGINVFDAEAELFRNNIFIKPGTPANTIPSQTGIQVGGAFATPFVLAAHNLVRIPETRNARLGVRFAGTGRLSHNTIQRGIEVVNDSPDIEFNIIHDANQCVLIGSAPTSLKANDLHNCTTLLRDTTGAATNHTTITAVNNLAYASLNIAVDPVFANAAGGDYHLTTGSPCAVTEGNTVGLIWNIDLDRFRDLDFVLRNIDFSLGAYEFNGTCVP